MPPNTWNHVKFWACVAAVGLIKYGSTVRVWAVVVFSKQCTVSISEHTLAVCVCHVTLSPHYWICLWTCLLLFVLIKWRLDHCQHLPDLTLVPFHMCCYIKNMTGEGEAEKLLFQFSVLWNSLRTPSLLWKVTHSVVQIESRYFVYFMNWCIH